MTDTAESLDPLRLPLQGERLREFPHRPYLV